MPTPMKTTFQDVSSAKKRKKAEEELKTSRDELDCVSIAGSAMSTSYGSHDAGTNSSEIDTQVTYIG
jgi:hypothetical protein